MKELDASIDGGSLDCGNGLLMLLRAALEKAPADGLIEVRSSEPTVEHDLPAWCRITANPLVSMSSSEEGLPRKFLVRKGPHRTVNSDERPDWGIRLPVRGDKGILTRDWLIGRAGLVPEVAPRESGFAPRGAVVESGSPGFDFSLSEKTKVWCDEIADLYEQATENQWDASRDIPWKDLPPLPEDLERAVCQFMTFLAENEYSALYVPAKFVSRIHPQYAEVVFFLSTQMVDEARHIEAFTKRALANGGGLQYTAASSLFSLKSLFDQEDFSSATFLLSVLGEGTFLDLLQFGERHAPDPVTAEICRRARVDETRHVHFGMAHVRYTLSKEPVESERLIRSVEERAQYMASVTQVSPIVQDALAILAAGGLQPEKLPSGIAAVRDLLERMHANRVKRLRSVGFTGEEADRLSRLHTPNFM